METIYELKNQLETIQKTVKNLIHGSIEIRGSGGKKYIYVHYREAGTLLTKYAGEYSDELFNLIRNNNSRVKELNKRIKAINKSLKELSYEQNEVSDVVKLNIDLARKYLVDSIYKQSVLEGVATTYSDTETLVNEGRVNNMSASDVQKIINLKHAWEFILDYDVATYPTNYALLCQINSLVEEGLSSCAGKIRSAPVTIGGSSYLPPIPFESQVKERLEFIINRNDISEAEKAARLIAYAMKTQTFLDGNKRTAVIFGNHYLISKGLGLMVVPIEKISEYKKLLIEYYEDKSETIFDFFINECFIKTRRA
ncbi:MAG: Fic family protein [Bacilli bacterium]|nr:Fic family protein [Bacilli bacterium]